MDFEYNQKTKDTLERIRAFMDEHIYPVEQDYYRRLEDPQTDRWQIAPLMEELKAKARKAGLWNLFLPDSARGGGFTNLEYAPFAEEMGRVVFASEVFNCSAPDTGNMEVLERYANEEQKKRWLEPLLAGEIRSAFAMTEPDVASSDATNIRTEIRRDGDEYVINGRKWWTSGAADPRCKLIILMGRTNPDAPRHLQQSQILVDCDTPGVAIERNLPVFGYDDAPHGHGQVMFENVRVPVENIVLGEGRGFEIAQGRLGPGRIHHCMRTIGVAERALEAMCDRLLEREAFGKKIGEHSVWEERVANARIEIECARLLTLKAAHMMDTVGNKVARAEIAMIKVKAPNAALQVIDDAIQAFGGAGVTNDFGLAYAYAAVRTLRIADGPDEVHRRAITRLEYRKAKIRSEKKAGG
ncbi:MAG: acyl-CoA dehydrogenase family protein [Deltaproteobacteria bacterium]|jgi:alkylation response protein AidB-like acyl-CoA dehydrogenase|nr:acyl-CoA dehydrogenase family protein [Deltaproteobacteria bacterium]MBW2543377.1 acyl-CoA dehydrogenase family protein [Deltaproteobacteria bacterium]